MVRQGSVTFGPFSGAGPRSDFSDVAFPSAVAQAAAVLTGMSVGFSSGDGDHHLGNLDVRLSPTIMGSTVRVTATYGLRDWSGNWDDQYDGQIFFSVVAE
jgi:hypothetical protein